jgi:hypothetical protein
MHRAVVELQVTDAPLTAMAMPAEQPPAHALPTCQPIVLPDVLPAQAGAGAARLAMPTNTVPLWPVPKRSPAHYLWAALIARIYEVFPLLCRLVRWPDANHRVHHPQRRYPTNTRSHRDGVTSGWSLGHRAYRQHASRRCGMGVRLMRKGVRMPKSSQTGIWRRNRP